MLVAVASTMALGSTICAFRASSNHFWNWSIGSAARSDSSSPAKVYSRRNSAIFIRSVVALLISAVEMFCRFIQVGDAVGSERFGNFVFFVQPFAEVDEFAAIGTKGPVPA